MTERTTRPAPDAATRPERRADTRQRSLRPVAEQVRRSAPSARVAAPVRVVSANSHGQAPRSRIQRRSNPPSATAGGGTHGLPDRLRAGIEQLGGVSMADVTVHRNSAEPAAIGALAYAQGNDIWMGPGQDRHLAHEAWHVVQQKQGRVRENATLGRRAVNLDTALERDADTMGARAERLASANGTQRDPLDGDRVQRSSATPVIQGLFGLDPDTDWALATFLVSAGLVFLVHYFIRRDGQPLQKRESKEELSNSEEKSSEFEEKSSFSKEKSSRVVVPSESELVEAIDLKALPPMNATRVIDTAKKLSGQIKFYAESTDKEIGRITPKLCHIVLNAVATPRDSKDERLASGALGPIQAELAIDSLVWMPAKDFDLICSQLLKLDPVRQGLLLKTVASRVETYKDGKGEQSTKDVLQFGEAIGEESDTKAVLKQSSLRDMLDKDTGLQQRFVNTCGPTSFQVARGELDPSRAWKINSKEVEGEGLSPTSPAALEQLEMLGADAAPPAGLKPVYDFMVKALTEMKEAGEPVLKWLSGADVPDLTAGDVAEMFEVNVDLVTLVRRFAPFTATGSNYNKIDDMTHDLSRNAGFSGTGSRIHDAKQSLDEDTMEDIDRCAVGGQPVPIGVNFVDVDNEDDEVAGHEMVITDVRGETPKAYEYLIYEPSGGKSFWVKRANLRGGKIAVEGRIAAIVHTTT